MSGASACNGNLGIAAQSSGICHIPALGNTFGLPQEILDAPAFLRVYGISPSLWDFKLGFPIGSSSPEEVPCAHQEFQNSSSSERFHDWNVGNSRILEAQMKGFTTGILGILEFQFK